MCTIGCAESFAGEKSRFAVVGILIVVPILEFPSDRIVGVVRWNGSRTDERGPVLATRSVVVPDDTPVSLEISSLQGSEPTRGGGWSMIPRQEPVDLAFVRALPTDAIESVSLRSEVETSFEVIAHLAPGLRRLYLTMTRFSDAVLTTVARLNGLTYLQTFGNRFTDRGVQQLATLVNLEHLYLEEDTLSLAAFDFVERLPHLTRLGLQDVPLSEREIEQLRSRLPGVDVG
jgi:hypothetical protein